MAVSRRTPPAAPISSRFHQLSQRFLSFAQCRLQFQCPLVRSDGRFLPPQFPFQMPEVALRFGELWIKSNGFMDFDLGFHNPAGFQQQFAKIAVHGGIGWRQGDALAIDCFGAREIALSLPQLANVGQEVNTGGGLGKSFVHH